MTTITVNTTLRSQFSQLGLSEKEMAVYLCLAELGKATAQVVARRCKLARTSAYFVLGALASRGLAFEERKKGTTYFSPSSPHALVRLAKEAQAEAAKKLGAASELERLLAPYFKSKLFHVPAVQFFEGKDKIIEMLHDFLPDWHASMLAHDNIWWGYQDHELVVEYRDFLEHYWKIKDKGQRVLLFSNKSELEEKLRVPNRVIRPVPEGHSFESTLWVCGEFVVVVMQHNKPQYAFQIKDRVLASNLRVIFGVLWKSVPVG